MFMAHVVLVLVLVRAGQGRGGLGVWVSMDPSSFFEGFQGVV